MAWSLLLESAPVGGADCAPRSAPMWLRPPWSTPAHRASVDRRRPECQFKPGGTENSPLPDGGSRACLRRSDDLVANCDRGGLGARLCAQLGEDVGDVCHRRAVPDEEGVADLTV